MTTATALSERNAALSSTPQIRDARSGAVRPDLAEWDERSLTEIWTELHTIQTDFCFPHELAAYFTTPRWHAARTVLDLGTGNGHYLSRLAEVFPGRRYHGIDVSAEYIAQACARSGAQGPTFAQADLLEMTGQYDFVVTRLVLQHLARVGPALDKIGELLTPGGMAFIIDAHDAVRAFHPEPVPFVEFFRAYASHQAARGLNRNVASELTSLLAGHPRLRGDGVREMLIPSTVGQNQALFDRTYYLVILMVEKSGMFDYDFERVKAAWRSWCALEQRYMQVGIKIVAACRV